MPQGSLKDLVNKVCAVCDSFHNVGTTAREALAVTCAALQSKLQLQSDIAQHQAC